MDGKLLQEAAVAHHKTLESVVGKLVTSAADYEAVNSSSVAETPVALSSKLETVGATAARRSEAPHPFTKDGDWTSHVCVCVCVCEALAWCLAIRGDERPRHSR